MHKIIQCTTFYWWSECSHSQVIKIEIRDILCLAHATHTEHVQLPGQRSLDHKRSSCNSAEKTGQCTCAKEEVSSSSLGKLALPCLGIRTDMLNCYESTVKPPIKGTLKDPNKAQAKNIHAYTHSIDNTVLTRY